MSKRLDVDFVDDIQTAIKRMLAYVEHMNVEDFMKDEKTQDAVIRNIEIIGEAVKNISDDFKLKHDVIPWKDLAKVRDKLIHHYFGVNLDIVWNIIKGSLPETLGQLKEILKRDSN